jgi:hypothetical protein
MPVVLLKSGLSMMSPPSSVFAQPLAPAAKRIAPDIAIGLIKFMLNYYLMLMILLHFGNIKLHSVIYNYSIYKITTKISISTTNPPKSVLTI